MTSPLHTPLVSPASDPSVTLSIDSDPSDVSEGPRPNCCTVRNVAIAAAKVATTILFYSAAGIAIGTAVGFGLGLGANWNTPSVPIADSMSEGWYVMPVLAIRCCLPTGGFTGLACGIIRSCANGACCDPRGRVRKVVQKLF